MASDQSDPGSTLWQNWMEKLLASSLCCSPGEVGQNESIWVTHFVLNKMMNYLKRIKVVVLRDRSTFILSAERVARWNKVTLFEVQFDFEGRCRVKELVGTSADLQQDLPKKNRFIPKQSRREVIVCRRMLGCQSIRLCPLLMPSYRISPWNENWWQRLVKHLTELILSSLMCFSVSNLYFYKKI